PSAVDACDPSPSVSCVPPSGSSFPFGASTVNCTSSDHAAVPNSSSCSFTVNVIDTTPPTIATCTSDASAQCTSPAGPAGPSSTPAATDSCGSASVACAPASGSTFALGHTTVTCTATDLSSNQSQCTFDVHVVDTVPPTITCPGTVTAATSNPAGRPVTYSNA